MVEWHGLEKFSHLEDKIYRTIELTKTLRQEKDELERQLANYRHAGGTDEQLVAQVRQLQAERDLIRAKVEKALDAIATIDPEIAEAIR
jgi:FtsZ-binding cell division protein ZapB